MNKEIIRTEVAMNLRHYRSIRSITQKEMADLLDIKRDTYAKYETTVTPSIDVIKKISEILGVTPEMILKTSPEIATFHQSTPKLFENQNNEFVFASDIVLTVAEAEYIKLYRSLNEEQQKTIIALVKDISKKDADK